MHVVVMSEVSRITTACISIIAIPGVQSLSPPFEYFSAESLWAHLKLKNRSKNGQTGSKKSRWEEQELMAVCRFLKCL
jgi:hypothetical protein